MIDRIVQLARRWRRAASRTRWTGRLLHRPPAAATDEPGLVILQIDGLPRSQFDAALAAGRLPHLARLVRRGHYRPMSFYSGVPSTTPAVQGEVMFGVRGAVPAFQFFDRARGRVVRMFESGAAAAIAARLAERGEPLLAGGSSYSNIYAGGAAESRFCAETLDAEPRRWLARPLRTALLGALYAGTVLRVCGLAALELVIAVGDMVRGVAGREDWQTELTYVPSRVAVSIVLREYLRVMVKLAIDDGRPAIYANFLGYDEQSHRRGPGSWFAHWALKGIDGVIGDISRHARRAPGRNYEVIVFSDHGQERVQLYESVRGLRLQDAVERALAEESAPGPGPRVRRDAAGRGSELAHRARRLMAARPSAGDAPPSADESAADDVIVTALGPLGHVYLPDRRDAASKRRLARRLVDRERVPTALYVDDDGTAWACNRRGTWPLPDEAAHVLGPDHPYLDEATVDLVALCRHENAGDIVISGWDPAQQPVTFVGENGAHGSVGTEELRGVALVPDGVTATPRSASNGEAFLRGEDLYRAARDFLDPRRRGECSPATARHQAGDERTSFRVMTYNVHSCIGLDGRVRPERVLQVIRSAGADVIALQEVDAYRPRSRRAAQAQWLAERLEMSHRFFAVLEDRGEQYGLAVLSRFPLTTVHSAHLTPASRQRRCEARGAMWVELTTPWGAVQLVNTHFGLSREERLRQAAALAGAQWLGRMGPQQPAVLCGDLNAGPRSSAYRLLASQLADVQLSTPGRKAAATFPSPWSVRRLDHIFVSRHFGVAGVSQPRTPTAVLASDHLPLCADLALPRRDATATAARGALMHASAP